MISFRTRAAGVAVSAFAVAALLVPAPAFAATGTSHTFWASGAVQTWTVPSGVTEIHVDLAGASGGSSYGGGGGGAELTGTLSVTPGETLNILVGSAGGNGQVYFTGAGGGGGSFIYTTADPAGILAAAGGGGGAASNTGGHAASTGTSGTNGGGGGGAGGTGGNGGAAGTASSPYGVTTPAGGGSGVLSPGFGRGGAGGTPAGGGGGGYSGGGGGSFSINGGNGGGGGGGSYFSGTLTQAVTDHGGNGFVTISYPAHLTSLSAPVGHTGDSLTIGGNGLAGATVLIGGVAATVTSSSDTELVVTVPAQSPLPSGALTVAVSTADGVTLHMVGAFTYHPAPTVTALDLASVPQGSAPTVTITGARFTGATAVYFGSTAATSFTVTSDTSITATVPSSLSAGTVNTTVVTRNATSATSAADELTVVAYPVMTLSPGAIANGRVGVAYSSQITADGGTAPYTYSIASGTLPGGITMNAASGALTGTPTGDGSSSFTVTATDRYGNVMSASYSLDVRAPLPTTTDVSAVSGPTSGGTELVLTGTDFTGATAVLIGGTPVASFTVVSPTTISAVTAPGPAGEHTITVTTPGGTSTVSANVHFTHVAPPTVTAVGPTSGTTLGGTSVTITGTGFTGASAVDFGGVAARSFTVDSDTSITAVLPASAAGTVDVTVTTVGGVSAVGAATRFAFDAPVPTPSPATPSPATVAPAAVAPTAAAQGTLALTGTDIGVWGSTAGGLLLTGLIMAAFALTSSRRRDAAGAAR